MQVKRPNQITVTDRDLEKLLLMLENHDDPAADSLESELDRAVVVPQSDIPSDVVTMNSQVTYEDCQSGARRTVRLVYPAEANSAAGRVSVLAPIGSALLGLAVGQEIEWAVPSGRKRIRVVGVDYQPEAMGDLNL